MTAMMIDDGKRVAAGGTRLQWHTIPIADIDLIARNTRGEENGVASSPFTFNLRWREALPPSPAGSASAHQGTVESLKRDQRRFWEGAEGRSEVSFLEAPI